MTNVREPDLAEARELLDQTYQRGTIPLPQLTDVDLCVFSESFASLVDQQVWDKWLALDDGERNSLTSTSLDFLEQRRLLRRSDSESASANALNIQPKLSYVLGIRQHPSFIGVCSTPGWQRAGDLRLFGLQYTESPEPIILLERSTDRSLGELGRIYEYALATPGAAGNVTADWVHKSITDHFDEDHTPRYVDIYGNYADNTLSDERLALWFDGQTLSLTHSKKEVSIIKEYPIAVDDLANYVAEQLKGAARS